MHKTTSLTGLSRHTSKRYITNKRARIPDTKLSDATTEDGNEFEEKEEEENSESSLTDDDTDDDEEASTTLRRSFKEKTARKVDFVQLDTDDEDDDNNPNGDEYQHGFEVNCTATEDLLE